MPIFGIAQQISETIVQNVIQAPKLAQMKFRTYFSRKVRYPPEICPKIFNFCHFVISPMYNDRGQMLADFQDLTRKVGLVLYETAQQAKQLLLG